MLALFGSLFVAVSWSLFSQQQAYQTHSDHSKLREDVEPALYDGHYPIYYDAIGAYITCSLDSPEVAHQAWCTFDVLFHGSSRAQSRMSPLVLDPHLGESHMQHCLNIIIIIITIMNPPEYFTATFFFAQQHRFYIRDLSNWKDGRVAFIQEMKSQAERLLSG